MRIEIKPSASRHGIVDTEIRAVIEHPALCTRIEARTAGNTVLYVGRVRDNEPLIEVIAEHFADAIVAFHAMYLTHGTIALAGIGDYINAADIARTQRR